VEAGNLTVKLPIIILSVVMEVRNQTRFVA